MKKITREELDIILMEHKLWLISNPDGKRADLQDDNLRGANLRCANLQGANLCGADLQDTDLRCTDLRGANLQDTDLRGANLRDADLRDADLRCTNLWGADLRDADLRGANLWGAENVNYPIACPEKGEFVGFKKVRDYIVELKILEDALRCSATSRKCRCSKALVVSITNMDGSYSGVKSVSSSRDFNFIYTVGETVEVEDFDENRWNECSTGIHFFITRQEAVDYI